MKPLLLLTSLGPTSLGALALPQGTSLLTLEQTLGRGADRVSFAEQVPRWTWAWDGVHLETERDGARVWLDPLTLEPVDVLPEPQANDRVDALALARSLYSVAAEVPEAEAAQLVRGRAARVGEALLVTGREALVWVHGTAPPRAGRVEGAELAELSPDGTRLAFVRDHDLFWIDLLTGTEHRVTDTGTPELLNGKLDWVYQEEVYGRGRFKGWWWSPDSASLAFLSLDESPVHDFTLVDHIEEGHFRVKPEVTRYPKAGDPNPITSLGLHRLREGRTSWLDLSAWAAEEPLVTRVFWTPAGDRCLVAVQDRIQSRMELLAVDPSSGAARTWLAERRERGWVDRLTAPVWLEDGRFLLLSERDGWRHLYVVQPGEEPVQLTHGAWEVASIEHVDEGAGTVLLSTRLGDATGNQLLEVRLGGGRVRRLTQDSGTHGASFNAERSLLIDRRSRVDGPTEMRLVRARDGVILHTLGEGAIPAATTYPLARWERLSIPTRDGFLLDAQLQRPADFDEGRVYPVWVMTYSGPDAPTVRDRWSGSAWEQFLAQQGVLVFKVNVRTASKRGQVVIEHGYGRFGVPEVEDMSDAVDWLCAHPWADGERVGITGYSYGGFMTARCLLTTDRFALGIAGGGVYDWRMYDTIYTERYMGTPQENPSGYEETSCLDKAADLHGFLHLHHGAMDDNVHLQQLMHMAHALMEAGRTEWSMMVYPQTRHGIRDPELAAHARRTEWRLIQEHLRPSGPAGD